jgi:hypothetical protein
VGDAGGRRESGNRIGRATISKADDFGTSNDESIQGVGPDVGPLESVVHSGEAGEFAGGRLIGASVLHINLNAAWVILGLSGRVKGHDLIANQVLPGGEPSGNVGSPLVTIGNQLLRGPFPVGISGFIDLEPFTVGSLEVGAISVARSHKSRDRT